MWGVWGRVPQGWTDTWGGLWAPKAPRKPLCVLFFSCSIYSAQRTSKQPLAQAAQASGSNLFLLLLRSGIHSEISHQNTAKKAAPAHLQWLMKQFRKQLKQLCKTDVKLCKTYKKPYKQLHNNTSYVLIFFLQCLFRPPYMEAAPSSGSPGQWKQFLLCSGARKYFSYQNTEQISPSSLRQLIETLTKYTKKDAHRQQC